MKFLIAHFQKHSERKRFDFFWRITLESLLLSSVISALASFAQFKEREFEGRELPHDSFWLWAVAIVVGAPVLETIVFQMIPTEIMRLLKTKLWLQIAVCTALFCILHAFEDVGLGLAAGLVGGFYLAFTYVHWRDRNWWTATWMTIVSHAIGNAVALAMMIYGAS